MDKSSLMRILICGLFALLILVISVLFLKAIKIKQEHDIIKKVNKYRNYFHYSNKTVDEKPVRIVSQFRNDNTKTGFYKNLIINKIPTKLTKLTKQINGSVHGASKATPAVDSSGIYIGADDGWFYKFKHNGEIVWKTYFSLAANGVHGTALLSEKYLWIGAYNGTLYCLKKHSGEIVWSINLGGAIGASPSFFKDMIIISVELLWPARGYIAAVSAYDGRLIWSTDVNWAHIHSSVAINFEKAYGMVGTNSGLLLKIDLHTGKILWIHIVEKPIKSTPLIYRENIYVTNWSDYFVSIHESGKLNYKVKVGARSQSSPTLIPGLQYAIFGKHRNPYKLIAVDMNAGTIKWQYEIENTRGIASGISFFINKGKEKQPLFMYPCTNEHICFIQPGDGKIIKKINIGKMLTGSIVYFNKRFYMNLDSGGVVSLE